jgi:hypothetical protein
LVSFDRYLILSGNLTLVWLLRTLVLAGIVHRDISLGGFRRLDDMLGCCLDWWFGIGRLLLTQLEFKQLLRGFTFVSILLGEFTKVTSHYLCGCHSIFPLSTCIHWTKLDGRKPRERAES